jgi:hypothetical protein
MAKTNYIIWQETEVNGDYQKVVFPYSCDEDEMTAIKADLVGKITVFKADATLSDADTKSMVVANSTDIDTIQMKIKGDETQYFGAYGKPVRFDASKSGKEIGLMFKGHKPFPNRKTEHPQSVKVNLFASVAAVETV